eukprot:s1708_g13.t1
MKLSYTVSRFQVLSPSEPEEDQKDSSEDRSDDSSASRHGRRSARSARSARPRPVATGAWSEDPKTVKPEREFVYYTDRQNWEEEAEIDTRRLQARWQSRDMHRWEEEKRKAKLREEEKLMQERIRREAYGEVDDEEQLEAEAEKMEDETLSEGEEAVEPLPPKARVVPIILKTKSVSQFDMLMEEIERVGNFARLRIVIVHGGLGPVIPKDIVHAEVEKRYGYCPVYAFQVGVHPVALGQAHAEQIDIRRFNVFTELLEDLMDRCGRINQKNVDKRYIESLKEERPSEHDFPNALTVWLQDLFRIVSEVNSDGQICPQVDGHALVLSPALGGSDCIQSRATTTELEDLDAVRRPTSQV